MLVSEIPAFREYFMPVAASAAVTDAPVAVELLGERFVVWRPAPGAPAEAQFDECPHRAARLSQGWLADGCLVCPYHGWRFASGGACVMVPQNDPELPIPSRARLAPVHCEERYGLVWLCAGVPRVGVPDLPEAEDPAYTTRLEFLEEWQASAPRIVDNSLDISHVAWVHRGTVGDPEHPRLPPFTVERQEHGFRFSLTYVSRATPEQQANLGITTDLIERNSDLELVQPLVFRGVLRYPNGVVHVLFKGATPMDDHRSLFWQFVARNDAPDDERWTSIVAVDRAVTNEDRPILEAIVADFPLSPTTEIHTRADRMTLEYRRVLADLAAESPDSVRPDSSWSRST